MVKNSQSGSKLLHIAPKCSTWIQMAPKGSKVNWRVNKLAKIGQNWSTLVKIAPNGFKWLQSKLEVTKLAKIGKTGPQFVKIGQFYIKLLHRLQTVSTGSKWLQKYPKSKLGHMAKNIFKLFEMVPNRFKLLQIAPKDF